MASRQRFLDALLLSDQPVERVIKLLLIDRPEPQHRPQRTVRRLAIQHPRRRQLGHRIDDPRRHHGDAQCHLARRLPATLRQHTVKPNLAQQAQRRRHVPVRQAAQQTQSSRLISAQQFVAKQPPQRFDLRQRPVRDIGQRALPDLAALAIALPQQIGGRRGPVRNSIDMHGQRESCRSPTVKTNHQLHGYKNSLYTPFRFLLNDLTKKSRGTSG